MLVKYLIEQEHDLIENSQFYLKSQWFLLSMIIQYFSWRVEKQGFFFLKAFSWKLFIQDIMSQDYQPCVCMCLCEL